MIDRLKRDQAATLIRQFLQGQITSDDLESDWPTNKADQALEAVGSMAWLFYDDHKPRRMVGKDAAAPEESELLGRYAAFLDTDHPYEWPTANFIRIAGLGALVPLSLGILRPVDRWIKARNAKLDAAMDAHGDWSVWPFRKRDDWAGEPFPPFIR